MTNKTAMERMVEELEKNGWGEWPIMGIARRLLKEEQEQKPTREELLTILSAWESVFGTSQLSHASARLQAAEDKAKRLEFRIAHPDKPTAPASLVEFPCPTCGAERFKTERRPNGDSWCRYGHKHPTKDFKRPAPDKSALVEELREWRKKPHTFLGMMEEFDEILSRHTGEQGKEGGV